MSKSFSEIASVGFPSVSPKKSKLYDYSVFNIVETGSHYSFPIHDDTPNKLLSGVIYLSPKKKFQMKLI